MSAVQTEHVLVVSTQVLREVGYFEGFAPQPEKYLPTLLDPKNNSYRPRPAMEQDPSFKQLIPYVLIRHGVGEQAELFQYTRGSGQGESRLHSKSSIGIGGHISTLDETSNDPYLVGMQRELDEEVAIDSEFEVQCVGLINDDSNEVGRVHLGVVHILDVATPAVTPREEDICDAGFRPVRQLLDELPRFESWSQICLRSLFGNE